MKGVDSCLIPPYRVNLKTCGRGGRSLVIKHTPQKKQRERRKKPGVMAGAADFAADNRGSSPGFGSKIKLFLENSNVTGNEKKKLNITRNERSK